MSGSRSVRSSVFGIWCLVFGGGMGPALPNSEHQTPNTRLLLAPALDLARGEAELVAGRRAEQGDRGDADDRDQRNQEHVLDQRRSLLIPNQIRHQVLQRRQHFEMSSIDPMASRQRREAGYFMACPCGRPLRPTCAIQTARPSNPISSV